MPTKVAKELDELEGMLEFQCGLWYSPYVKIYTIGGSNRIAEISNYPRAYKDTIHYVYTKDTSFIVTENDLNDELDDKEVYRDSKDNIFYTNEEATHWAGDSLPGAFPLWLESEDLSFLTNLKEHVFPVSDIPGPVKSLTEARKKVEAIFVKLSKSVLAVIREKLSTGKITLARRPSDSDKQVIRIKYQRVF